MTDASMEPSRIEPGRASLPPSSLAVPAPPFPDPMPSRTAPERDRLFGWESYRGYVARTAERTRGRGEGRFAGGSPSVTTGFEAVAARRGSANGGARPRSKGVDVEVPVSAAYDQWTQFEEFPKFMEGVVLSSNLDDSHVRWVAEIAGERQDGMRRSSSRSRIA